jgi:hypothetical protein
LSHCIYMFHIPPVKRNWMCTLKGLLSYRNFPLTQIGYLSLFLSKGLIATGSTAGQYSRVTSWTYTLLPWWQRQHVKYQYLPIRRLHHDTALKTMVRTVNICTSPTDKDQVSQTIILLYKNMWMALMTVCYLVPDKVGWWGHMYPRKVLPLILPHCPYLYFVVGLELHCLGHWNMRGFCSNENKSEKCCK